jgi:tetratricopeptide (TPR) repeat protein
MRVGQIRILAWAIAFVLAAVVFLTSGNGGRHGEALPHSELPSGTTTSPPALFPSDGAAGMRPVPPKENSAKVHTSLSDSQLRTAHVIREPRPEMTEPELTWATPYQLKPRTNPSHPASQLPLDALLREPAREDAPVGPRVSKNMANEPTSKGPPPSPLPIMGGVNPAMQPVNAVARQHVVRGFSLGDKAAVYAARTEFIQALRTIAQAVDAQAGLSPQDTQSCSLALVRGLQALSEADDFAPSGSRLDGNLDLGAIIAAHHTPACKRQKPASQLAALQIYFDFARDELQRAAATSPVASQALAGLGKSYTVTTEKNQNRLAPAKAMVFHQAAVTADSRNHLAANELGVLLAKHGQWELAKQFFLQSLRTQPDPSTWQNLAAVHLQLGERDLAQLAEQERQLLLGKSASDSIPSVDGKPTVQWVDPKAFAGPPEDVLAPPRSTAAAPVPKPSASAAQKSDPKVWSNFK